MLHEKGKPHSVSATNKLKNLILGKKVEVIKVATGPYGRIIANVKVDGKSVNTAMKRHLNK